ITGKMTWQRNYEAISATPMRIVYLVLGELTWIALRLVTVATAFTIVITLFGVPRSPLVLLAIPCAMLTGLAFAAPIMAYAATRAELMELAVASGLKVIITMLEEDRTAICGQRYQHQVERQASRAGTVPSEVVLGGRKVALRRPRVRAHRAEVPLPTFQTMASEDPLNRRVVEQMLVGVATRQ